MGGRSADAQGTSLIRGSLFAGDCYELASDCLDEAMVSIVSMVVPAAEYPDAVALERFRGRLPLLAFILLAVVCVLLLGFACACLTDHPMQAIERALSAIPALPALLEVWPLAVASLLAGAWLALCGRTPRARSPALLQRLLL